jgi:hypothetical protein
MTAWAWIWVVVAIWAGGMYAAARLARRAGTLSPPYEPRIDGWTACPGCKVLQRVDPGGRIADHDRPTPWTPQDSPTVWCDGSGQPAGQPRGAG